MPAACQPPPRIKSENSNLLPACKRAPPRLFHPATPVSRAAQAPAPTTEPTGPHARFDPNLAEIPPRSGADLLRESTATHAKHAAQLAARTSGLPNAESAAPDSPNTRNSHPPHARSPTSSPHTAAEIPPTPQIPSTRTSTPCSSATRPAPACHAATWIGHSAMHPDRTPRHAPSHAAA